MVTRSTLNRTRKELPREPTDAMIQAMEKHYEKWRKITGRSRDTVKSQCWDALHAYYAMWDAAPEPCVACELSAINDPRCSGMKHTCKPLT